MRLAIPSRIKKLLLYGVCTFIILVPVGILIVQWVGFPSVGRVRQFTVLHVKEFLEDGNQLANESFFQYPSPKKDAGPFLASKVFWTGPGTPEELTPPHATPLSPDLENTLTQLTKEDLKSVLFGERSGEVFAKSRKEILRYNLTWMAQLKDYDFWDMEKSAPKDERKCSGFNQFWCDFNGPRPKIIFLKQLVQIRLVQGVWEEASRKGSLVRALDESRHFAHLLSTSGSTVMMLMSVALLHSAQHFYDVAVAQKLIPASLWKPMAPEQLKRAERFYKFGARYFFPLATDGNVLGTVVTELDPRLNICPAVAEVVYAIAASPYLEPYLFPERDFRPHYQAYDRLLSNTETKCPFPRLRRSWAARKQATRCEFVYNNDEDIAKCQRTFDLKGDISFLPYVRRLVGLLIVSFVSPATNPNTEKYLPDAP